MSGQLLNTALALWGAILSTVLAVIVLWNFVRDRPKLRVDAEFLNISCGEADETKGTKTQDQKGNWFEVCLKVTTSNTGSKPLQIIAIYIDGEINSHQVFPKNLPIFLEPRSQVEAMIQKEWLDNSDVREFGVLDALGKHHPISQRQLQGLIKRSNDLPSNKKKYSHNETGEIVEAFQVKDKASTFSRMTAGSREFH